VFIFGKAYRLNLIHIQLFILNIRAYNTKLNDLYTYSF
jgi:hypothetical protein